MAAATTPPAGYPTAYIRPRSANEITRAGDDQVIERADVDERQRLLQRLVRSSSARLGSATPDGWLCAKITAAALRASAALTTSRG